MINFGERKGITKSLFSVIPYDDLKWARLDDSTTTIILYE